MDDFLKHYFKDRYLIAALLGQGVIGTNATPMEAGTAGIYFHHTSGCLERGREGEWGYVKGGMGEISTILAKECKERGVEILDGVEVLEILPGKGVIVKGDDSGKVLIESKGN